MSPLSPFEAHWPAISALLDEALSLPTPERASWLAGLVGERASHREVLRTLLANQAQIETADFLNALPRLDMADPAPPRGGQAAGSSIGAYRLIAEIGQGGMSTVWLAERADGLMNRRVALKLPRIVWGDSFAERLAREREILATLEHEHIARLYDAGIDAHGRPFLAMEYVDGQPIDAYCRAHALPVRERVALLLQVMAAVSHAHSRLVVHRDLKPSNILVTRDAKVKLLDFGIAKLLEGDSTLRTALTELSGHALTLDYASPEQIRGEPLGTTSDVYSLAVVAYEVLTDARPYRLKRGTAAEIEEAIAGTEPRPASEAAAAPAARKALRGDLDAILNHALKKAVTERYQTVDAFAQDLTHHLSGVPVLARPDSKRYRAMKFVGRHRLQVAAGSVAVAALVAGATLALWQAREARVQAQRAQAEAATAQAVQAFLENIFLTNSGDQADPTKARETTARELLDRGAERIDTELQQQPAARLRLLSVLASMYEGMQLVDKQIAMRRQQWKEASSLSGPNSDDSVTAMAQLAHALTTAEQRPEATTLLRQAAATLDARGDHDSRARFWVDVMQASLDRRIDPRHGFVASDRALSIARRYPPDDALLLALQVRGDNASFIGEHEQARQAFAEFVRIAEAHPPLGANELALMYGSLANVQSEMGQFAQADASQRKGVELARRRAEPLAMHQSEMQLAMLCYATGRFRESVEASDPAWRWANGADAAAFPGPAHWIKVNHAVMLLGYGRVQQALTATDQDPSLSIEPAAASGLDLSALSIRARALTELGRLAEARAVLDRARSLVRQSNGKLSSGSTDRAERPWLVASGRAADALAAFQAAGAAPRPASAPDGPPSVAVLAESAWLTLEAGDAAAAQAQAAQALAAIGTSGVADYQRHHEARATLVLGRALLAQHRAAESLPVLEKAVELHRAVYDPDHSPAVAKAVLALAEARRALGDPRAANAPAAARR